MATQSLPQPTAPTRHKASLRRIGVTEGKSLFDKAAQRYMRMSGEEFLMRYNRGDFANEADDSNVVRVAMLRPFAHSR